MVRRKRGGGAQATGGAELNSTSDSDETRTTLVRQCQSCPLRLKEPQRKGEELAP